MATKNTQFLHFNAYSIKEMIIRKLTEDTKFTDQIYEGSNLNILIDLVSYMYQCLMYNLNSAAAESMFADTQIYENINRLVKFIGYNPKGIIPSSGAFYFDNTDKNSKNGLYADKFIQKYSYINTGEIDEDGYTIYYSTIRDIHIDNTGTNSFYKFPMYNGKWKLHYEVFTATGVDYESFILTDVGSDLSSSTSTKHVANGCIDVYVEHLEYDSIGRSKSTITQYTTVDYELFAHNRYDTNNNVSFAQIYTKNSEVVNVRLNEDKIYEIKFGNDIIGKKLKEGDRIYVFYLETNGKHGKLTPEIYTEPKKLIHDNSAFGLTQELYEAIFTQANQAIPTNTIDVYLDGVTTDPVEEENADQIRQSAPEWFKLGQRLITHDDYAYYIKNLHNGEVLGVCAQNNFTYASTFYKWLYLLGKTKHGRGDYYINEKKLALHNYNFVDPADSNNVYVWLKLADGISLDVLKDEYNYELQRIKALTTNVVFMNAIEINFSVTAMPQDVLIEHLENETYTDCTDSYIEVTMDNNIIYATGVVAEQINSIITNYFKSEKIEIGTPVNINDIVEQIYKINGIIKIRTIYMKDNDASNAVIVDGLCFASWSNTFIDIGDDMQISTSIRSMQEFQYPVFYDTNLTSRIKVIRQSINNGLHLQI